MSEGGLQGAPTLGRDRATRREGVLVGIERHALQHVRSASRLDALNESNLPKVRASGDDGDASGFQ